MTSSFFVSDLHGNLHRYETLFREMIQRKPSFVFIGGDILPNARKPLQHNGNPLNDFIRDYLVPGFQRVQKQLGCNYPEVFLIMGNDDHREEEGRLIEAEQKEIWKYLSNTSFKFGPYMIYGYPYVPPTPFRCKDWEKYDVSRFVDPGCISPAEGYRTADPDYDPEFSTIAADLEALTAGQPMDKAIFLFHSPPYNSALDRAALDGQMVDHVPLDVHVGSMAIQRFIETRQPYITLHGHIHESASLTGNWKEVTGRTHSFSAAHQGPELALVTFKLDDPADSGRELL